MQEGKNSTESTIDREMISSRILNAPRELVWQVWTDPDHIAKWWGPSGFTNTIEQMDVKPGGVWLFTMHGPDGVDYPNKIVYEEVLKPERIVYHHVAPPFQVTVTFEDLGDRTKVTMHMLFGDAETLRNLIEKFGAKEGLEQNLDRLLTYLEQFKS